MTDIKLPDNWETQFDNTPLAEDSQILEEVKQLLRIIKAKINAFNQQIGLAEN